MRKIVPAAVFCGLLSLLAGAAAADVQLRATDRVPAQKIFDMNDRTNPDYVPLCGLIETRYIVDHLGYSIELGNVVDVYYLCQAIKKERSKNEMDSLYDYYSFDLRGLFEHHHQDLGGTEADFLAKRLAFFDDVIAPIAEVNNRLLAKFRGTHSFKGYADLKAREIVLVENAVTYAQTQDFPPRTIAELRAMLQNMRVFFEDRAKHRHLQTAKAMKY